MMKTLAQRRVHERVVFSTQGEAITECENYAELIRVIIGAVKGYVDAAHKELYMAGVLHCDISVNSILIDKVGKSGTLIGLDLASELEPSQQGRPHQSETIHFMAFDVMLGAHSRMFSDIDGIVPPFQHAPIHDLESFVWLLLFRVFKCKGHGRAKRALWEFDWICIEHVLYGPSNRNPLCPIMWRLRIVINEFREKPVGEWPASTPELYKAFLNVLESSLSSTSIELQAKRYPFHPDDSSHRK
ncbi:hypothetical protein BU17DRAFT_66178 [Hysterangium stoloniferum]|nr:hypothetical protein BU17DRAFT_66178 [Hysterangium stoloniferum]